MQWLVCRSNLKPQSCAMHGKLFSLELMDPRQIAFREKCKINFEAKLHSRSGKKIFLNLSEGYSLTILLAEKDARRRGDEGADALWKFSFQF